MSKVLSLDETIKLHKCNAYMYKEMKEDTMRQNEENLVTWLEELKRLREETSRQQ